MLLRAAIGLIAGYIAYLPALGIQQFLTFGRFDGELFFYGLCLPFQFPFVFFLDFRGSYTDGEILLQIVGISFMILGVWLAVHARKQGAPTALNESEFGLEGSDEGLKHD
jgi:hypothetical protein